MLNLNTRLALSLFSSILKFSVLTFSLEEKNNITDCFKTHLLTSVANGFFPYTFRSTTKSNRFSLVIILDKLNLKSDGNLIALFRNHLTSIIKIMDIAQDVVAVIYFTNMNQIRPLNQSAAILTLALSPGY